jgi:hypothetical protein
MYKEIQMCRICGNSNLVELFDLGEQALTGIFPLPAAANGVQISPLVLVKCDDDHNKEACGLVQLKHTCDLGLMYGDNYGYRTGLNASMVKHVQGIVKKALNYITLKAEDLVIDIGSNDSTLLQSYKLCGLENLNLLGVDPSAEKFKSYYPDYIKYVADFFTKDNVHKALNNYSVRGATAPLYSQNPSADFQNKQVKAKMITSISMFYDLEAPQTFMQEVYDLLDEGGVWVLEQSYLPTMLKANSYDTICHEHLEYYCLKQIKWMADRVGFKFLNVEFNDVNGGSFAVTLTKSHTENAAATKIVNEILADEKDKAYTSIESFLQLKKRIDLHAEALLSFLKKCKNEGKKVFGYGASTKGNVLLQYCKLDGNSLPYIAEVNEKKFGALTPGSGIKIISETEAKAMQPDYFLVLPWHFKANILQRETKFLAQGGHLVFPLPEFHIV